MAKSQQFQAVDRKLVNVLFMPDRSFVTLKKSKRNFFQDTVYAEIVYCFTAVV